MAYLLLGNTGDRATSPLASVPDIFDGDDFDLRVRVRHTHANFGTSTLENWLTDGDFNAHGVQWKVINTNAWFQAYRSGANTSSSIALTTLGLAKDVDTWVRVMFNGTQLVWYSSTDDTNDDTAVTWGTAKETDAFAPPSWEPPALDPVVFGGVNVSSTPSNGRMEGRMYRQVWYDETPTKRWDSDFSDPTTWTYS